MISIKSIILRMIEIAYRRISIKATYRYSSYSGTTLYVWLYVAPYHARLSFFLPEDWRCLYQEPCISRGKAMKDGKTRSMCAHTACVHLMHSATNACTDVSILLGTDFEQKIPTYLRQTVPEQSCYYNPIVLPSCVKCQIKGWRQCQEYVEFGHIPDIELGKQVEFLFVRYLSVASQWCLPTFWHLDLMGK